MSLIKSLLLLLVLEKAQDQESGAPVEVGEGQDLAKEENLKAGNEGKCSKAQKRKILETAGMKANRNLKKVLPNVEPLKKKYFFRDQSPAPRCSLQYGHLYCVRTRLLPC